ncbi:hypothetical protein GCM10017687_37370 [Streptomyces echinatus]
MVLTHRERTERAKTQRELSNSASARQAPPAAARPRCLRRHNAATSRPAARRHPSELTVNKTLRERGQIRDVPPRRSTTARAGTAARRNAWSATAIQPETFKRPEEASK